MISAVQTIIDALHTTADALQTAMDAFPTTADTLQTTMEVILSIISHPPSIMVERHALIDALRTAIFVLQEIPLPTMMDIDPLVGTLENEDPYIPVRSAQALPSGSLVAPSANPTTTTTTTTTTTSSSSSSTTAYSSVSKPVPKTIAHDTEREIRKQIGLLKELLKNPPNDECKINWQQELEELEIKLEEHDKFLSDSNWSTQPDHESFDWESILYD